MKQRPGESLRSFFHHFAKVRSQIANLSSTTVIDACMLNRVLSRNPPKTTEELYQILQEYARGKDGDIAKKDTPRGAPEGTPSSDQPQASVPSSKRKRRRGKKAPSDQARKIFAIEGQTSSQKTWQPKKPPRTAEGGAGRCLIHNSVSHSTEECNTLIAAREEFQARMQIRHRDEKAPEAPRPANVLLADPAPKEENLPFQEPTHHVGVILGGSATGRGSKRQHKEYVREVNVVGTFTPTPPPKWASVPISFTEENAKGIRFPHDDALFVTAIVSNCELKKILVEHAKEADGATRRIQERFLATVALTPNRLRPRQVHPAARPN